MSIEVNVQRDEDIKPSVSGGYPTRALVVSFSGGDTLRLERDGLSFLGLPQSTPAESRSRSQAQITVVEFLDRSGRKITHRSAPDRSSLHIPSATGEDLRVVARALPKHWGDRHPGEAYDPRRIKGLARALEVFNVSTVPTSSNRLIQM